MKFGENYSKAIQLIDKAYQENKELVSHNDKSYPKEYLYALRMVEMLEKYYPQASEEVYLAARCQHLYRWEIPRNNYPLDRKGYHQWRTFLYTYQANKSEDLLKMSGYGEQSISDIKDMIEKKDLLTNEHSQLLEDVVCLVFLSFYIDEFIEKHHNEEEKLKRVIKNTWLKMSENGHEAALSITYKEDVKSLILEAIK